MTWSTGTHGAPPSPKHPDMVDPGAFKPVAGWVLHHHHSCTPDDNDYGSVYLIRFLCSLLLLQFKSALPSAERRGSICPWIFRQRTHKKTLEGLGWTDWTASMWFCPVDGTLLLVGEDHSSIQPEGDIGDYGTIATTIKNGSTNCFYCVTCAYSCPIAATTTTTTMAATGQQRRRRRQQRYTVTTLMSERRKQVDDILGGAAAWSNVDRTMTVCPACNHNEAYFLQMQIRSADEPMSIFYKCTKCNNQWNDK